MTEEADTSPCCASCGIAELDDIKLKPCDGCDLAIYCSDECKEDHRPEHEAKCKERAAELRDEILFRQPEGTHLGDCPICSLPLSLVKKQSSLFSCCSKSICMGCSHAYFLSHDWAAQPSCPFCRQSLPRTDEEGDKNTMKRVAANEPVALCRVGQDYYNKEDYESALKYWTNAAALGHAEAHYNLSFLYLEGHGVEKDEQKQLYHLEEAAIQGHPIARHNLAWYEMMNRRIERAVKHLIIGANLGHDESITRLKACYKDELVSKEDFAAALRAHHVAVNATKSPQRVAGWEDRKQTSKQK